MLLCLCFSECILYNDGTIRMSVWLSMFLLKNYTTNLTEF